jgi:hypothetical protein
MTRLIPVLLLATISLTMAGTTEGRPVPVLSYEELFKEAELVIIANAVASVDAGKDIQKKNEEGQDSVAVLTTIKVIHVVKGKHSKKKLELVHYRLRKGASIKNGPSYVKFDTRQKKDLEIIIDSDSKRSGSVEVETPCTTYLIFLKKRADGYYECVTGQTDPIYSVKKITDAEEN